MGDRGGSAGDLKPFEDVFQVLAYGGFGDRQPPGDLVVGVSEGDEPKQLALAGRQPGGAGGLLVASPGLVGDIQVGAQ